MSRTKDPQGSIVMDKRIQDRRRRAQEKKFETELQRQNDQLPDLSERVAAREPEELESFQREFLAEKKLREQRMAKQVRSGEQRQAPQAEPLPGDTRD